MLQAQLHQSPLNESGNRGKRLFKHDLSGEPSEQVYFPLIPRIVGHHHLPSDPPYILLPFASGQAISISAQFPLDLSNLPISLSVQHFPLKSPHPVPP
ncbi:hypothetical protein PoB_005246200 [Plakobranchus ocellatus]|uniref:Uncharacterized protein n=1 Tax=Plakobranchus ocellatus TaxID=259542 RepID=A0AAV4C3L9_9GAST|nr:hypothetical protein PoB_005246200 [Plakobranchus ocellatus]